MSVPYDYDQTNIEHLRAVVAEQERTIDYLHERCTEEEVENAKLRDALKDLMMGANVELCADRDQQQCRECSMRRGDDTCVTADAMLLLGIDIYGEPLEVKS